MGNLWGDLLRPKDYIELHPQVMKGVDLHKTIDAYTDSHPAVDAIVKILRPSQGKYTPVVADVLMDYMLCKHWSAYHDSTVESFCQQQYAVVDKFLHQVPERLHVRIGRMRSRHWLESCKDRDNLRGALFMLSQRASFENNIPGALSAYDMHATALDDLFKIFFEELRQMASLRSASLL